MRNAPSAEAQKQYAGTGIIGWLVVGLLLAIATVIFVAQNVERVQVEWLWFDFRVSLAVIALGGVLIGVLASVVLGLLWRRRRRKELQDAEELATLRGRASHEPDDVDFATATGTEPSFDRSSHRSD